MNDFIKKLSAYFVILLSFFSFSASAQVNCTAEAPSQVPLGKAFTFQISLNTKPSKIANINFSNFNVLNGPNQ
ncbi:MAG: hypothetical protein RR034_05980, partial [Bacteroidales bacterium]